jgi:hypothetical protein
MGIEVAILLSIAFIIMMILIFLGIFTAILFGVNSETLIFVIASLAMLLFAAWFYGALIPWITQALFIFIIGLLLGGLVRLKSGYNQDILSESVIRFLI